MVRISFSASRLGLHLAADRINELAGKHHRLAIKVAGIAITSTVVIAIVIAGCML